jgi:hypothetical protein
MTQCWKCLKEYESPSKISFRGTCPSCDVDQHVCKNCRHFSPSKPNDCIVPGTEYVRDREAANFCEEFSIKAPAGSPQSDPMKRAKKLFGEDLPPKRNPLLDD